MAKRRQYLIIRKIGPPDKSGRQRIVVPQPEFRPLHIRQRSLIKKELLRPDAWWFVLHRRGIYRPRVGEDPQEARAIPHSKIRGTLLERIIYKKLLQRKYRPGTDFTFQSSLDGGRAELGGIVADFIFPQRRIVLNPTGPAHNRFLNSEKDKEQRDALMDMGYVELFIPQLVVLSEPRLEAWFRRYIDHMVWAGNETIYNQQPNLYNPAKIDQFFLGIEGLNAYVTT